MTTHAIDWLRLARTVEIVRVHHGLSERALSDQLGMSPNTFARLRHGEHIEADAVATLVAWLNPIGVPDWIVVRPRVLAVNHGGVS